MQAKDKKKGGDMENYVGYFVLLIFLGIVIYRGWRSISKQKEKERLHAEESVRQYQAAQMQKDQEQKEGKETKTAMESNDKGTRDLFLETLTKIGCQYELPEDEEDGRIMFAYQGEHFLVNATNNGWYIHIHDPYWEHVELYDIDDFARLKKVINGSNLNNCVTTVYTIDEAGKTADVHCKSTILFVPQIPHIEDYLRVELNEFFRAHQYVHNEMAKLREQEA